MLRFRPSAALGNLKRVILVCLVSASFFKPFMNLLSNIFRCHSHFYPLLPCNLRANPCFRERKKVQDLELGGRE
jgi:hypothetical protein